MWSISERVSLLLWGNTFDRRRQVWRWDSRQCAQQKHWHLCFRWTVGHHSESWHIFLPTACDLFWMPKQGGFVRIRVAAGMASNYSAGLHLSNLPVLMDGFSIMCWVFAHPHVQKSYCPFHLAVFLCVFPSLSLGLLCFLSESVYYFFLFSVCISLHFTPPAIPVSLILFPRSPLSFSHCSLLSDITLSAISCNVSVPHSPALDPSLHLFPPLPPSFHEPVSVVLSARRLIAMPRSRCEVQGEGFG